MIESENPIDREDPFDLSRFLSAQEGVYARALAEIRAGSKRTHWMWFIFPQIDGLGSSSTARRYAIRSAAEAQAYLGHPLLGKRLRECTGALLELGSRTASQIFGYPDDLKLRSSMTLFDAVANDDPLFSRVLEKYYGAKRDEATIKLLGAAK